MPSRLIPLTLAAVAAPLCCRAQAPLLQAPLLFEGLTSQIELVGDLDGDADVDAVAFFSPSQNLVKTSFTPLVNDGLGTLTAGTTVALPAGAGSHVLLADIDGDQYGDVLVATANTGPSGAGLLIYLGQAGGTFAAPLFRALTSNVAHLEKGNRNSDGIDDVLLVNFGVGVTIETRWILGDPTRAFALPAPATSVPWAGSLELVEANSDGVDDIALLVDNPVGNDNVNLFVTTAAGFAPLTSITIPGGLGGTLRAIDIDTDGDRDLLVSATISANIVGFTAIVNHGFSSWGLGPQQPNATVYGNIYPGDFDGDGDEDFVQRTLDSTSMGDTKHLLGMFENDGNGVFTVRTYVSVPGVTWALGAGTGDVDGDGNLDFVDNKSIEFGTGRVASPFGSATTAALVDWDGDGDTDAVDSLAIRRNDGTGTTATTQLTLPTLPMTEAFATQVVATDLDGDGLVELIVPHVRLAQGPNPELLLDMRVLHEAPGGDFVDGGAATAAGTEILPPVLVDDADGDGDLDLLNSAGVWTNDGSCHFTAPSPGLSGYVLDALADIDGDGDLDVLAEGTSGGAHVAVVVHGPGNQYLLVPVYDMSATTAVTEHAIFADLDDDGDPDIAGVALGTSGEKLILIAANAGGVMTPVATLPFAGRLFAGDIDGDGHTDLCAWENGRLRIARGTGTPFVFAPTVVFATPEVRGLADLDQDGDLDACGAATIFNRRFEGPAAGGRRQYGQGGSATGDYRPLASLVGPIRTGLTPSLRLRRALGGTIAILLIGASEVDQPSAVFPGVTAYVGGTNDIWVLGLAGTPLQPGAGTLDLPVTIPPGLAGAQAFLQFLVADLGAPGGVAYSNGTTLTIGP